MYPPFNTSPHPPAFMVGHRVRSSAGINEHLSLEARKVVPALTGMGAGPLPGLSVASAFHKRIITFDVPRCIT